MSLLNVGVSALLTSQNSLSTVSHNISNVNTEGYSRQRTEQGTQKPNFQGGYYVGSGVTTTDITRRFDNFLVSQVRGFTSQESEQNTFLSYSKQVDDLLGDPNIGLNSGMEAFFNTVQSVSNDPTSIPARQVMLSQGELLANRFNTLDQQLRDFDKQIDSQIVVAVDTVNSLSRGIANLNNAIVAATSQSGGKPNDLMDQRDLLITQLAEFTTVTTSNQGDGSINVFVGTGQALVTGSQSVDLKVIPDTSVSPQRNSIGFGVAGIDITSQLTGGSIGGAFQVRSKVLDTARTDLNKLAFDFVDKFNTQHQLGIDLDGNAGGLFFGDLSSTPASDYAATISVAISDTRKIAASSTTNPAVGNNENALALANLQTKKTTTSVGSFSDSYGVLVANVAARTHQADINKKTQEGLLNQTKLKFDSIVGVNLDEEAANLIKFQQSYQAASQIITVSNTVFNALINAV